jgi:hypothetical protein
MINIFVKRFLFFLGLITFLFLILFGAGMAYGLYLSDSLSPSAKEYADESVRAIITTWSKDDLVKRRSPELQATTNKGQLNQVFTEFKNLGNLQNYTEAEGNVNASFNIKEGLIITATYFASASFQHGKAEITIQLIRHHNVWQILGFHLNPADAPK